MGFDDGFFVNLLVKFKKLITSTEVYKYVKYKSPTNTIIKIIMWKETQFIKTTYKTTIQPKPRETQNQDTRIGPPERTKSAFSLQPIWTNQQNKCTQ